MNYTQLNTYLQTYLEDQAPSADYTTILPAVIQDSEQRIYRDMDFLNTRTVNSSGTFTANSRTFTLPTSPSTILTLQGVAAITPQGDTPSQGTRIQLEEASLDLIDMTWPQESVTGIPDTWAMLNDAQIVVKPTPAVSYTVELTGTFRPNPISAGNSTTYISLVYPDLMIAACMVYLTGFQQNFGAQSANPQMSQSWEAIYQDRKKSALDEEQRRKGSGTGWSPFSPTEAQPART